MRVKLDEREIRLAMETAVARRTANRRSAVRDGQMGKQDPWQTDIDGVIGEFAFAKLFGYFPDLTAIPRTGTPDFTTREGKSVDVKATRLPNGRLVATPKKATQPSDLYALMVLDDDGATFCGWIEGTKLFSDENLTDLGHGPTYAVKQDRLSKGRRG